jgi:hypothetical protein
LGLRGKVISPLVDFDPVRRGDEEEQKQQTAIGACLYTCSAAKADKKGKLMSWRADPKDFVCGVAMKDSRRAREIGTPGESDLTSGRF